MSTRKNNNHAAKETVPLSRFGVLVAQLESIVASASVQAPDPLLCFDLLSDLNSVVDDEPKESILQWQRKCEDALYSLLVLGARRPVRHLASVVMARIIMKGDPISVYSRVSSLQGFLSDGKKGEPQRLAGVAQCLGELYRLFGRRITSGLLETTIITSKLMRYSEEYVRKEALFMLQNALEGSGGAAVTAAYTEAFRVIMRFGVVDKSFIVRIAAARCLKTFADIGGPGLGVMELENSMTSCVKALDDPVASVRDSFAEALGSVLALGLNPEAQVQPRGKGQSASGKKLEGCLQRYLVSPFVKAAGTQPRELRIGLTLSWVSFLQAMRLKYLLPDTELQDFALQVLDMLRVDAAFDAQSLACVLYILRVGVTDQMTEPTQRSFLVILGKQLASPDLSPAMKVAALRTLSYALKTLGEVPVEFKEQLDDSCIAALSHTSRLVRVEAALTLRAMAEVDPICVGGLISFGITTLSALRENVSFERGSNLSLELDSLHGQATMLAALVAVSPQLPLGYPARLPKSVLEVAKKMVTEPSRSPEVAIVEKEAGWLLLSSLLSSVPKEEFDGQVFDILALWGPIFSGNIELEVRQTSDTISKLCVWASAMDALTSFIKCFISLNAVEYGILLQPVLLYLRSALSCISFVAAKELPDVKPAMDVFIIRLLIAFQSLSDPLVYGSEHPKILQICTAPFRNGSGYEESSCLRMLLDKRDAWLGPWKPGRDWFEDELRAFQGGKDGLMPCVWDLELPSFPQPEAVSKILVNQMLLSFGVMFAFQDSSGMLSLLTTVEQCLKSGRKQLWHAANVTNACVGLLAGLKALIALRPQPLGLEVLSSLQTIFQGILWEGDICPAQRRAASEGLGLLTRLRNDAFTARMTKLLHADLIGPTDSDYAGSIVVALGCIHRR
ncbi:SWEETIE-like protein [Drosera capensis]